LRRKEHEKIELAKARVRSASKSFLANSIAAQPSAIFLHQILGSAYYARPEDTIPEESRSTSQQPADCSRAASVAPAQTIYEIP
uniref:BZIP domain-containing protein n=1 Tax=Toxocara canis TaxID=6265 RepID=A0A183VFH0_TOXCA